MNRLEFSGERIAILFILGILLFSPPFILIFDRPVLVAGIPVLFLYLIVAWAALITLMMLIVEYTEGNDEEGNNSSVIKEKSGSESIDTAENS